jgi:catechol 2,3-dioxygenase-like lactoylglutathione lyase family enzyme
MTPKMNAIGIVTADMARSLEFYSLLGLQTPAFNPDEDHFECDLGNGTRLMWDTLKLAQDFLPGYDHGKGGSIGLAFECGSASEVNEAHAKLASAGFRTLAEPWDAFWGQRYAIVADPDDNAISLYAAL